MSSISTHVLDLSRGAPAEGVEVSLEIQETDLTWKPMANQLTQTDGRVSKLFPQGKELQAGVYRITFGTGKYFVEHGGQSFYPYASVVFEIQDVHQHYHIPLLISPYGYSTYRGS